MPISTPQEIIDDIRAGKMVILMDDEDRENEVERNAYNQKNLGVLRVVMDVVRLTHDVYCDQ